MVVHHLTYTYKRAIALIAFAFFALCPMFSFAALDISLLSDKSEVRQGEQITYTATVTNYGSSDATDVLVVDSIPKGVIFLSCSSNDYTTRGRSLIVKVPRLRAGDSYTFDVTLRMERKGSVEKLLQLQRGGVAVKNALAKVEVLSNNVLDIKVNMFTPNGDGVNDYFEIPGLQDYPNNELVVFNRFSDKVFQKRYYNNDWDAAGVPNGNYYYLLTVHLDNGTVQKYNGYVTVKR